ALAWLGSTAAHPGDSKDSVIQQSLNRVAAVRGLQELRFPEHSKLLIQPQLPKRPALKTQPGSPDSHKQPSRPLPPGTPRRTLSQLHVAQGPQLPIGGLSLFFPAIGRGPATASPLTEVQWFSPPRLRRGGKVH
ncbi:hypothetical protein MC885_008707, partial [Smutsia gigantea]